MANSVDPDAYLSQYLGLLWYEMLIWKSAFYTHTWDTHHF